MAPDSISERISAHRRDLTPAERRVAELIAERPEAAAFGTVARVATQARTSGPTVLRMAAKIGFDGFAALQAAVQEELAARLRPAAERIRQRPGGDPLARATAVEVTNVRSTLEAVDPQVFDRTVRRLSDVRHSVLVASGDASRGVAYALVDMLALVRDGVEVLEGSRVGVARRLAVLAAGDVLVTIDARRYDRWVVDAARMAGERGAHLVAITDGLLSPLAEGAAEVFVVDAQGAGPFDSHVGTLALVNALAAATASRRRRTATSRLDRIEAAWAQSEALLEP